MDKILFLIFIFFIAFFFYLIIPAIGAILVRDNWKKFRLGLIDVSLYPIADYSWLPLKSGKLEKFRFFGTIEAIQGENRIWITDGNFTLAADLNDTAIFMLPSISGYEQTGVSDQYLNGSQNFEPTIIKWNQLYSIAEGTQIFIAGELSRENEKAIFKSSNDCPLIVVIYDGERSTILKRAILCGRQRNEYWNQFTLASLICGIISLLLFSFFLLQSTELRFIAISSLSLGLLPVSIFLPPGIVLFYYYRKMWTKARNFRAGRDLILLPLHYIRNSKVFFEDNKKIIVILPDNTEYVMHKGRLAENLKLVKSQDEVNIRKCFYTRYEIENSLETYLFGSFLEGKTGYSIIKPSDPMAELVLIPGKPEKIIKNCQKKSTYYITLSVLLLFLDIVINFIVISLILQFFIK